MQDFHGKTAVVTGAGSGIGRGIALALADAGVNVVVADIRIDSAERVRDEVIARGAKSIAAKVDVADRNSVVALADLAYERFAAVDILCNNAGVVWKPMRSILDATIADWKWMIDVNLFGVIHGLDVFVPRMRQQTGPKHIVNTSSITGLLPQAGLAPYSTTKAAIAALSEAIAEELRPHGFAVTILLPGAVRTNMSTGEELRPSDERSSQRNLEPYVNARVQAMYEEIIDPEAVGRMVKDAIANERLYLSTHRLSRAELQGRIDRICG
jgi:NAD(P)-dependent dehydrogenase (short-subunit alcohol dehydrogenase family)